MRRVLLAVIAMVCTLSIDAMAQDVIVRRNPSQTIICKVLELGDQTVKYIDSDYGSELTFTIDRNNIVSITLENGKQLDFKEAMLDPATYQNQRKSAIKTSFFAPLAGSTYVSFERSIKPGQSYEVGVGVIGLGITDNEVDPSGIILRAGYKFNTTPTFYNGRSVYSHILKGGVFQARDCLCVLPI